MIVVTGDLHREYDIRKLDEIAGISKVPSVVLIAGDFGGIWFDGSEDDNGVFQISEKDAAFINRLSQYPFKIISCLGNHENYDVINRLPRTSAYGGKVIRLSDNVELLDRGYVYTIEGYNILSIGGAMSMDRIYRQEHISFWMDEVISSDDIQRAFTQLKIFKNKVDFVLTHTCPLSVLEYELNNSKDDNYEAKIKFALENDPSAKLLDKVKDQILFRTWYYGHFHIDKKIISPENNVFHCLHNSWVVLP